MEGRISGFSPFNGFGRAGEHFYSGNMVNQMPLKYAVCTGEIAHEIKPVVCVIFHLQVKGDIPPKRV